MQSGELGAKKTGSMSNSNFKSPDPNLSEQELEAHTKWSEYE